MPFPTYAKKEDIPAGAEDVYEEKDGRFVPKLEDTSGLKSTLATVRQEKDTAEKALKSATDAAAKAQRELDALRASGGDIEAKTKELLEKWEKDKDAAVGAVRTELEAAQARLRTLTLDDKAKAAFIAAGGRPEKADAALKLAKDRLDLADDRIVVKDEKGAVSTTAIADFWGKDFKKEMPELYKGSQASGGGASGITEGGGASGGITADEIMKNPSIAFESTGAAA